MESVEESQANQQSASQSSVVLPPDSTMQTIHQEISSTDYRLPTTNYQPSRTGKYTKITKLVLDGFKSFGRRTEFLFGDNFNCVIGANGSGKSNLGDALCFVLGKSSSKALRAEKSSNLIYNGGKTKNPSKSAEVSIFFDNKNRVFPLEDDEIKITRLVNKDGQSKYKINNKTRTRQEVLELLSSARIDPDGYNIILQGDIVLFVEMSSIERRQIIEEIAGIGAYEEKKNQALNELNKVEQKLGEAEIILKERESYLKDLKKDHDQAVKYKSLSENVKKNKASYIKKQIDKKTSEVESFDKKIGVFRLNLDKIQKKIDELRSVISNKKSEIDNISKEIEQKGEKDQRDIQKDIGHLNIEIATEKTKIQGFNNELQRLGVRKIQLNKNIEDLKESFENKEEKKKEILEVKKNIEGAVAELNQKMDHFRQKHNLNRTEGIEKDMERIDHNSEELQKNVNELREKQQNLFREKDRIDFQINTMDDKIRKVLELEKQHKVEIDLLKKKKEQFKNSVIELNALLNKDSKDAVELVKFREKLQVLKEEHAKLEVKNASIKESSALNTAVKKILENKNKIGGVFGTVSELGDVEAKYAVALEIAAAQRLTSIVVEDDKIAAKCIKFLKSEKFGVATFLPLNKIRPRPIDDAAKKIVGETGVHGFALDLISFDLMFKNVFSYVFGNTIVVDDIETARKIGIGKVRMVTVEGDLAEISGAMIGGYRIKKEATFREKGLLGKIDGIDCEINGIEKNISCLETDRKESEEKIMRLRQLKASLEGEIIKTEKSLHLDSSDLDASKKYKEELIAQRKSSDKLLGEIDDGVQEKIRSLTDLKIEKQQLRNKIAELRNPVVLAELNAFEQKKKEFYEEILRLNGELTGLEIQQTEVIKRDKENNISALNDIAKEEAEFQRELLAGENRIKFLEADLREKEKDQQVFYAQYKSLFEKRNQISGEINFVEKEVLVHEDKSRKEELGMNAVSIEGASVKAVLVTLDEEFAQYQGMELDINKSEEQLKKEIADFEKMMANIGSVNMRALEIYDAAEKEYGSLQEKRTTLIGEKDDVIKMMNEIEANKKDLFLGSLKVIDDQFQKIFKNISVKGEAYLELENPEKPFEAGLRIKVKLTGDKFLDIRSLSGGEKTLTALAFIFAIQEHEPACFYVLDEVDAALDKSNSEKLAKLIRKYCENAQYLVISHNDALIQEADTLFGISMNMNLGISSVVSLKI